MRPADPAAQVCDSFGSDPRSDSRQPAIQHDFQGRILAGLHVHLDHDHCLEVLVAKGKGADIRHIADALLSVKGVKHGKLTMTTTGKGLSL
ncbi:MAG: hypothetical protein L6Q38_19535 [Nitrospira sp.]|nr:hypothetical protein [Nitrospira sp.]